MKRPVSPTDGGPAASSPRLAAPLAARGELKSVLQRAEWLAAAGERFRQGLPPALTTHVRLANVDGDTLVVLVSTPAWKARMRMETPAILAAASAAGLPARVLAIKVAPETPLEPARRGASLSAAARESLRATACSVSDPNLRAELLRLADSQARDPTRSAGGRGPEDTDRPLKNR